MIRSSGIGCWLTKHELQACSCVVGPRGSSPLRMAGEPCSARNGAEMGLSCCLRGSGAVWWGGSVSAEGELGEGDEVVGVVESVGDAGDESDFGVDGFDAPVAQVMFDGGQDAGFVVSDGAS